MSAPVLVTGATGNVGREVVRALGRAGLPARAAVTDTSRALPSLAPAVPRVKLDFLDPGTFEPALEGARGVFLLRPPAISDVGPTLCAFLDAAGRLGVEHVVFLSVAGAERNRFLPHRAVEDHLRASGLAWTLLRPGFFAQNLGDAYREDIRDADRLYVPAGRGRAAFVDVRDVAEVAAAALSDARHRAQAYTLTGGEALSFGEVAGLLAAELGRPIRYEPASILGYVRHLRRRGSPAGQVAVTTLLHVLFRVGQGSAVDSTLARLLGRPPTPLAQYIRDNRELWQKRSRAGAGAG